MLEHTKKPPTENVENIQEAIVMLFEGPYAAREKAITAMRELGFVAKTEGKPWKEALNYNTETWSATCLRGGRTKEGLTQQQLSELTGIPRTHISDMERGRRPIGKQTAKKLASALKLDARLFLGV